MASIMLHAISFYIKYSTKKIGYNIDTDQLWPNKA